jgi:hypothetical protein
MSVTVTVAAMSCLGIVCVWTMFESQFRQQRDQVSGLNTFAHTRQKVFHDVFPQTQRDVSFDVLVEQRVQVMVLVIVVVVAVVVESGQVGGRQRQRSRFGGACP